MFASKFAQLHKGWPLLLALSLAACHGTSKETTAPTTEENAAMPAVTTPPVATTKPVQLADPSKLVIHYHRFDGNYDQAGIWTWDARNQREPGEEQKEVLYSGETEYGVYFVVDPSLYGNDDGASDRIGFIPRLRRDWNQKDGSDRFWTPEMGREVWLIGGNPQIFRERPDISPKIANAYIDAANKILVRLSHPMPVVQVHSEHFIVKHGGSIVPLKAAQARNAGADGNTTFVEITTEFPLDYQNSVYEVSTLGYRAGEAKPRNVLFNMESFGTTEPLGAVLGAETTTFRQFSPLAKDMTVVVYDNPTGNAGRTEYPMERKPKGVWEVTVPTNLEGKHYALKVTTDLYGTLEFNDPYATNTVGDDAHARITDLRKHDPEGFRPFKRPAYGTRWTDAVIYEIHIRDFSIDPNSGATDANRGKYMAFTQRNTVHPADNSIKTMVDHLVELGVTHVQILPPQDFDNDEDNTVYNWGYMTAFFNSPEGWYASEIRGPHRVKEFKEMVKALHEAGIGVILDVVYNHTGVQNTFNKVAPGYFLRTRDDGSYWNGSGTGNEFRSESPMGRRFIIESCKFWMEEYGVDGFRFDLMGLVDLKTLRELTAELKAIYPEVLIYGEPWAAAESGIDRITYKDVVKNSGVAAFNDHFRNAIKGPPDGGDPGYVQNSSNRDGVKTGIAGSIDDWAAHPWESINYVTCHDNLTLWDKLVYSTKGMTDQDLRRMQKLSGGILAVSQGILFYHGGCDFSRTKGGNHNSYNADDSVNMMDWTRKKEHREVFEFHKGMIAIRKAHPMFRLATAQEVRERIRFLDDQRPAPETIVFTLNGQGLAGESWQEAAVFINPTPNPLTFKVPFAGEGQVWVHDGKASATAALAKASGTVLVPGRSMTLVSRP